jgi:predicted alpha-1,2-mannosidase
MVGDPADPTIAGAWAFGARDFDVRAALALMRKGATDPSASCSGHAARLGLTDYVGRGYCPVDVRDGPTGPTSTTLEYAVADFSIAQFAKNVGDDATYKEFLARGQNWRNVFDPSYSAGGYQGYPQPRRRDNVGGQPSFQRTDPASTDGFIEGNPAQYTFFVPHDPYGLISALGGEATTVARLDTLFSELNAGTSRPFFYIGNEPQFGTPWLYPFARAPYRTQAVVRRILREVFSVAPGGLPGNDDLGATSAWQVWAMLGMYPAVPGAGVLVLGSPSFPKASITLGSGAKFVIVGDGASADAPYIQSVRLNGAPSSRNFILWDEIRAGATLDVSLGASENMTWGTAPADRPPTFYP